MANSTRKEPGTQSSFQDTDSNPLESVVGIYETYKKQITTVTTVLVIAIEGLLKKKHPLLLPCRNYICRLIH